MGGLTFGSPVKLMIGGQMVEAKCGQLTFAEEDVSTKDDGFRVGSFNKSCDIECNGLVHEVSDELNDLFDKSPQDIQVAIERKPGKMPRKMKKAYRSDYSRNTKWVRKANNYIKRNIWRAQHAEMVITKEDFSTLSATLKFDKLERGCDSVMVSGHRMQDVLMKYQSR